MMVVNANPGSRRQVEEGDWCLRVNPGGVDLNRNWDEHWDDGDYGMDTNPGHMPFSEPETQLLKQLVSAYQPTTFLTIHSGTLGMYMPWAFDMEHLADRNQQSMMEVLKSVDKDHCQCPYGAAGREVGYSCPGTCLDWVFDKLKTPYSFAFEIYYGGNQQALRDRWQERRCMLQMLRFSRLRIWRTTTSRICSRNIHPVSSRLIRNGTLTRMKSFQVSRASRRSILTLRTSTGRPWRTGPRPTCRPRPRWQQDCESSLLCDPSMRKACSERTKKTRQVFDFLAMRIARSFCV
ncbi:unnamed protein product [Effrenium voratum]|nr:unnamed protein product [Effrenium voratum]